MRIVTPGLINAFPNKIINIHPSLLPKYNGLNAVKQALDSGDKITGCTVHYVTEELDSGGCIDSSSVLIWNLNFNLKIWKPTSVTKDGPGRRSH